LAKRYVACGQLSDPITPGNFLAWANRIKLVYGLILMDISNNNYFSKIHPLSKSTNLNNPVKLTIVNNN
jgi:hypothetical protein